jgi:hypothetical protein
VNVSGVRGDTRQLSDAIAREIRTSRVEEETRLFLRVVDAELAVSIAPPREDFPVPRQSVAELQPGEVLSARAGEEARPEKRDEEEGQDPRPSTRHRRLVARHVRPCYGWARNFFVVWFPASPLSSRV